VLLDVKGASVTIKGVVICWLVVVVGEFVVVVGGEADVVVVVGACVELVVIKVVASGIASVVSLLGRTDVKVGVEVKVVEVVELGLAVDGASVAGCVIVCEGFFSVVGSDGFSLLEETPMISEEMGILTTKGSSSFRPLLLLPLGLSVLLCLFT